jgi:hypothetical protein
VIQERKATYLVVSSCGQCERTEAVGDGVLVGVGLVAVLVGVDGGDHADEVLVQAGHLILRDDALGCSATTASRRIRHCATALPTVHYPCMNGLAVALYTYESTYLCREDWRAWRGRALRRTANVSCATR